MTPNEYSDVRQLYKLAIAYDSFTEVSKSCEYIMVRGLGSAEPGYYAIAVGIATLYSRPFTDNARIGKLSTKLVPRECEELHSLLIKLRNKAFAHSDADGRFEGHGKMTEVRLFFDGSHVTSFSSRPVFEPMLLPQIKALSGLLAKQVKERYDTFYERVLNAIAPRFGVDDVGKEFELNVENEKGPMVLKAADLIQHKYPVVRPLSE
jgi:hypothetical protein